MIELIVVVAIGAILSAIAIPSLMNMMRDSSISSATNQLVASLNYARSQALAEHTTVRVCQSSSPSRTSPACTNTSKGYASGWIIYADVDLNDMPSTPEVLKIIVPDTGLSITAHGSPSSAPSVALEVSFNALGMLVGNDVTKTNTSTSWPYIVVCDDRLWANNGQYARVIGINEQGRIASAHGDQQSYISSNATSCSPS